MGVAPTREAKSIVYRRKSCRKKNSSPTFEEPRGSAVGDTTNDSIAPNATYVLIWFITQLVQTAVPSSYIAGCLRAIRAFCLNMAHESNQPRGGIGSIFRPLETPLS